MKIEKLFEEIKNNLYGVPYDKEIRLRAKKIRRDYYFGMGAKYDVIEFEPYKMFNGKKFIFDTVVIHPDDLDTKKFPLKLTGGVDPF